jgi:hypothetical protein
MPESFFSYVIGLLWCTMACWLGLGGGGGGGKLVVWFIGKCYSYICSVSNPIYVLPECYMLVDDHQ